MEAKPAVHGRRRGRPDMATARRQQIVSAFLALIGERTLASVSLDDVAAASGVQRSVIRHYMGNRAQLVHEAAATLIESYTDLIKVAVGEQPSAPQIIGHLFSREWGSENDLDRAFDELFHEAARDPVLRDQLHNAYALLADALAQAIRRDRPETPATSAEQIAYQIVCLAEHNTTMQRLGFPAEQAAAARALAHRLATEG
ncbi:TetR/AcrR family transcriptional regulator [Actinomadura soli]|uniref:TetR/AcrR family transcriptional regulator n=1 Tax=Actinomadura soli TaxID=2508997 RepID=A0A5C4J4G8_9ACTN|nr:TetR family transcriptional regulator [Actinomadura soli]TMQ91633.1 TetR/AcrR family transcriptional regulator [Actinomadura soli]